jgi:multiple sugar transport system substrate-binding protein
MMNGRSSRRAFIGQALGAGAAGLAVACGSRTDRGVGPDTSAAGDVLESSPAPTPVRALSGTITVAYADELGKKPAYVDNAAQTLMHMHPNATVKIDHRQMNGNDFYEQIVPTLRGEGAPDVVHVGGDRLGELADADLIIPLDEYLNQWQDWRYYSPTVRDGVTYDGQIWAVPYGLDTRFLYFRRDIFEQAGLPADWQPRNVADILTTGARIRSMRPDVLPYALYAGPTGGTGTANHAFLPLLHSYGGALKDARGNWIGDSPAIRKAFAYYQTAFQAERLSPMMLLTTPRSWVDMRERLGDGRLAILFEGGWVYGGWADKDRVGTQRNIGYTLFPTESDGPSFTIGGAGTCWYITAASRNKDLAWEFIATWNNRDTVGKLNAEDPHPVARVDAVRVPEYRSEKFLVDSTDSMRRDYGKVVSVIQVATAAVATGEITPDEAARRYASGLREAVGAGRVVLQG